MTDDTAEHTPMTAAIERKNRIERLASPEQADELLERLITISQRIDQGVIDHRRLFMEGRDGETTAAAWLALKALRGKRC